MFARRRWPHSETRDEGRSAASGAWLESGVRPLAVGRKAASGCQSTEAERYSFQKSARRSPGGHRRLSAYGSEATCKLESEWTYLFSCDGRPRKWDIGERPRRKRERDRQSGARTARSSRPTRPPETCMFWCVRCGVRVARLRSRSGVVLQGGLLEDTEGDVQRSGGR